MTYVMVFLALAAGAIALALAVKGLVMLVGLPCPFCRHGKTTCFNKLAVNQKRSILQYFKDHEHRTPNVKCVFVCLGCKTVFDDFSGELRSMESNWCKVCNEQVFDCTLDNDSIKCTSCGTRYEWKTHEGSGFRFLMPPVDARLLDRCRYGHGVG